MPRQALVISSRNEDILFAQGMAQTLDMVVRQATSAQEVRSILVDEPASLVFWDVDFERNHVKDSTASVNEIGQVLSEYVKWDKVFALSDSALNDTPSFSKYTAFGHYFFRRYEKPAPELFQRIIFASLLSDPFGISKYLPEDTPSQKITIKTSGQKKAATEAVKNVFTKKGIHSRVVTSLTQAIDELLMNAIFDAPRDAKGKAYRHQEDRAADFELAPHELVELEIGQTPDYVVLCVNDKFGSIQKDVIVPMLRKNFQKVEVVVSEKPRSSGLGLNGITQAGLSLMFLEKPGVKTQAMLFVPVTDNFKAFKSSFRFFSFLVR